MQDTAKREKVQENNTSDEEKDDIEDKEIEKVKFIVIKQNREGLVILTTY
jgi:hypothetical protein